MDRVRTGLVVIAGICLLSLSSFAEVRVAFVEILKPDGNPVMLEPDSRFAHVAIEYQGAWLHAHPSTGVQWVKNLDHIGSIKLLMVHKDMEFSSRVSVDEVIGKPYDFQFSWDNNEAFYCSKLIAKILGIAPVPMQFDSRYWNPSYQKLKGQLGVSPLTLMSALDQLGFQVENICEFTLKRSN